LCLPHSGTELPNAVSNRLNATGRLQTDLSWRLERVFDFHKELDATLLRSTISRYVIDPDKDSKTPVSAARDPALALCPVTTLDGKRIYLDGEEPGPTEIEQRSLLFYVPFHRTLRQQIDRLLRKHRKVVVVDCQSMRSNIKGVTDKGLPLVSIGSSDGKSCDPDLRDLLAGSFKGLEGVTVGVDEHTKGGFLAQSYGRPDRGIHVMTLLLAQRAYLRHESPPFEPDKTRVARLRTVLAQSMSKVIGWTGAVEPVNALDTALQPETHEGPVEDAEAEKAEPQTKACESGNEALRKAEVNPVDPQVLPKVSRSQLGNVEDGPVTPLLVAE